MNALSLWIVVLLAVGVDPTGDAVRELLQKTWKSPAAQAKRTGNAVVGRASRQKADMAAVQYAYGILLTHADDWDAAEAVFKRIVKASPQHADAQLALCACHLRTGKYEPALQTLEKAVQADPKSPAVAGFAGALQIGRAHV